MMKIARQVLFGVLVGLGAACGGESNKEHVAKAEALMEQGRFQAASIELKNALQADPKSAQARWLLGKVELQFGDGASAANQLRRAQELGVSDASVLPLLVQALLLEGKPKDVIALQIPPNLPPAARSQVLTSQGLAYLATNDLAAAEKSLADAAQGATQDPYLQVAQARLAAAKGNFDGAAEILDATLKSTPKYSPGWSLLGELEQSRGNATEAEQAFSKAIALGSTNPADLLNRSLVRIALKQFDGARVDIANLKKQYKSPPIDYAEGLLLLNQRKYQDAQPAFQKSLAGNPDYWPAVFYAGVTEYLLGNTKTALSYLERVNANFPNNPMTRRILASIRAKEKDFAAVEQLLQPVLAAEPKDLLALNLMAESLVRQNKQAEGVAYLRQVADLEPTSAQARTNLAVGLLSAGDTEEGIKEIEKALGLKPDDEPTASRAVLALIQAKAYDAALKAAAEYRDKSPKSASAYLLLGLAHLAKDEPDAASNAFQQALKLNPGNSSANSALGMMAVRSGKIDQAEEYYKDTLKMHPGDLSALVNLAMVESVQGHPDEMQRLLEMAVEHNPRTLKPRVLLGKLYLDKKEPYKALAVLSPMRVEHPRDPALLGYLGEAKFQTGDYKAARSILSDLAALGPVNARAHLLLAESAARLGDAAEAAAELKKVLDKDDKNVQARLSLTRYQIAGKFFTDAADNIELLKQQTKNNPAVLVLEGLLAEAQGKAAKAEDVYQQVFQAQRNNVNLLRLTNAQWQLGNREEAMKALEDWLKEYPKDNLTQLELANRYLSAGKNPEAIQAYKKLLETAPKTVIALNNLAWLLKDSDPSEALKYIGEARGLAPDSPNLMDTEALLLLRKGKASKAEAAINRALDKAPGNPAFTYHKAMILETSGRGDEAWPLLERILSTNQKFADRDAAQEMLEKLVADEKE
jgi:putative PEP-CTERM system TPR-repeat lipoprotein